MAQFIECISRKRFRYLIIDSIYFSKLVYSLIVFNSTSKSIMLIIFLRFSGPCLVHWFIYLIEVLHSLWTDLLCVSRCISLGYAGPPVYEQWFSSEGALSGAMVSAPLFTHRISKCEHGRHKPDGCNTPRRWSSEVLFAIATWPAVLVCPDMNAMNSIKSIATYIIINVQYMQWAMDVHQHALSYLDSVSI